MGARKTAYLITPTPAFTSSVTATATLTGSPNPTVTITGTPADFTDSSLLTYLQAQSSNSTGLTKTLTQTTLLDYGRLLNNTTIFLYSDLDTTSSSVSISNDNITYSDLITGSVINTGIFAALQFRYIRFRTAKTGTNQTVTQKINWCVVTAVN